MTGNGSGGGLFNTGTTSFTGVTVNFRANQANVGSGGVGNQGGVGKGGNGGGAQGNNAIGGDGGNAFGARGGNGGDGGIGRGGAISNLPGGILTIKPRRGAINGSRQSKATDTITTNLASASQGGTGGAAGAVTVGLGASPGGSNGLAFPAGPGGTGSSGVGIGGGVDLEIGGTAIIDNTFVTGNHATTSDNDVFGTFTT